MHVEIACFRDILVFFFIITAGTFFWQGNVSLALHLKHLFCIRAQRFFKFSCRDPDPGFKAIRTRSLFPNLCLFSRKILQNS